jgi:hypothetical protein
VFPRRSQITLGGAPRSTLRRWTSSSIRRRPRRQPARSAQCAASRGMAQPAGSTAGPRAARRTEVARASQAAGMVRVRRSRSAA